ncbi:hypothetical protein BUE80_DR003581 [Diplocarpon rosae]|nr:hypothetical protein BUE80_DR003581 [Diplocarpon rosae]
MSTASRSMESRWVLDYAYQPASAPQTFGWAQGALDNGFITPDQAATPDIICHKDATNGAISLPVSAGATITVHWNSWPDSHKGPVLDYLASCKGDCATVDKTTLEFFKIDEKGLEAGKWASEELGASNSSWALYTPTDPGILVPGIYGADLVYDIPGPAVYNAGAAAPEAPAPRTRPPSTPPPSTPRLPLRRATQPTPSPPKRRTTCVNKRASDGEPRRMWLSFLYNSFAP